MEQRRRSEKFLIIAAILGLHAALLWLLIVNSRIARPTSVAASLELIFVPPAIAIDPAGSTRHRMKPRHLPVKLVPILPATAESPPAETDNSIHPPTDWNRELGRIAREAIARDAAPKPREFGFPKRVTAAPKPSEFEWDYVATHRVESMPEGGIVVHLNDNCVLVMFPLPFVGCGIGKKPANGQLFKHLHDPPAPVSEAAAP